MKTIATGSAITLAALLAMAAGAACARGQDPKVVPAQWLHKPTSDELQALWPVKAWQEGKDGWAKISCAATTTGNAARCHVVAETPEGYGFGAAALALAPNFVLRPQTRDGVAEESLFEPTIRFVGAPTRSGAVERDDDAFSPVVEQPLNAPSLQTPTAADMAAAWPVKAGALASGHLAMRCVVHRDGTLHGCDNLVVEPRGKGFEAAAHSLLPKFRIDTTALGPRTHQVVVTVPFRFDNPATARPETVLARPTWVRRNVANHKALPFPEKAEKAGLTTGRVLLDCVVTPDGGLSACHALEETPPVMDFAAAAMETAAVIGVSSWTAEGRPAQGLHVQVAVRVNASDQVPDAKGAAKGGS